MGDFTRRLPPDALSSLRALADSPGEHWWKHLLSLWRSSGTDAGRHGLRLAVRDGYLSFYRRGQSVARVGFSRGRPHLDIHAKYAFGRGETAQAYARLAGTAVSCGKSGRTSVYDGLPTLLAWITEADSHGGPEKALVDDAVADNRTVVDLEMGLPAWEGKAAASRIDCVAVESGADGGRPARIVFWEAKAIGDGRLRSRSRPEVADQFDDYRRYVEDDRRRACVRSAYREVCRLLIKMQAMAAQLGNDAPLDPVIADVAEGKVDLEVDHEPRLLIFGGEGHRVAGGWDGHLAKLKLDHGIPCLVVESRPFRFCRP